MFLWSIFKATIIYLNFRTMTYLLKPSFVTVILLAVCTAPLSAQEYKDFDLGTYQLPDIVRNQLDFSVHSTGEFLDYSQSATTSAIEGNFNTAFDRYKVTRSFIGQHRAQFSLSGDYDKEANVKTNAYNVGLTYQNKSRFYNDRLVFFETGADLSFSQSGEKYTNEEESSIYHKSVQEHTTELGLSVPLRVGTGRIERVEDARQAIYILENLSKRKVLERRLTDEEVIEFAHLISTVKNKRFFDSRLRTIEEVTAVDSFFVSKGLLATNGAAYFTTVYDYWMYGDRFERGAGLEFSGGLEPGFRYERFTRNAGEKVVVPSVVADIALDYEKPANLYWQHSAGAKLFGRYERNEDLQDNKYNAYTVGVSGNYVLGYYPNSRTHINVGIYEQFGWRKEDYSGAPEPDGWLYTDTKLGLNMYYYFSPRLRLSLNGSFGYNHIGRDDLSYAQWRGEFNATLTYSLF